MESNKGLQRTIKLMDGPCIKKRNQMKFIFMLERKFINYFNF